MGVGWSKHLWWLLLLGPFSLWFLWLATEKIRDRVEGITELAGTVTGKWMEVSENEGVAVFYRYIIQAQVHEFSVDERIYNWVSEGEEVALTFWPRTKGVVEVRKLGSETIPADVEA